MLNRFAHALLVATSLAPIALVYGVARWPTSRSDTLRWTGVAALLLFVCVLLVRVAQREGEREQVRITKSKNMDKEVLAFLVSYALPLVTPSDKLSSALALGTFILIIGVVLYQTELVHVNPLLGLMGFRFHEVNHESGDTALLITRSRTATMGTKTVVKLSSGLWLEIGT
jgi:hypothetical protein